MERNDTRERARFFREHQLAGGTYASALEIWNAAAEITDSLPHDGLRAAEDMSDGEVRDLIRDWHDVRRAGL